MALGGILSLVVIAGCGGGGEQAPARSSRPAGQQAAAPAAGGYQAGAVADGGTISGKVTFAGTPPAPMKIEVTKDTGVCGKEIVSEDLTIGAGNGVANAVVWVEGIAKGKDWGALDGGNVDQKGCHYVPHVQLMRPGNELMITNSDSILHNIHAYYRDTETLFNLAQPMAGMKTPKKLDKTGPVHLKCDVHSWMSAWVFVADHPYVALTSGDGSFSIDQVPAGAHKVKMWHAKLGEKTLDVTVAAGGTAAADFSAQ
jgi:plastocyanin